MRCYRSLALAIIFCGNTAIASAQNLPSYMEPISGLVRATPADTATKDMLALNTTMFELYGDAAKIFQANILAKHPVILGLFSGAGGPLYPVSPRPTGARRATGSDRLSASQISRSQHNGAG